MVALTTATILALQNRSEKRRVHFITAGRCLVRRRGVLKGVLRSALIGPANSLLRGHLLAFIVPTRFGPVPAGLHIAPAPAMVAARVQKQPAAAGCRALPHRV